MTARFPAVASSLACLVAAAATAQVPPGWYVAATFKTAGIPTLQNPFPGDGGLWLVHPRAANVPSIPLGPLGSDLTGAGIVGNEQGANCVLIRPDGTLAVGEITAPSGQVHLHVLTLAGTTVVQDTTYAVGTAGQWGGGVSQLALLPSGELLMSVGGLANGSPLFGARLARWSPVTGAVTPMPVAGLPGEINALAVDRTGTTAYLGIFTNETSGSIWRLPLAGGSATPITTSMSLPGLMSLDVDNAGRVVAGCSNAPFFSDVYVVDPATGLTTVLGATADVHNAVRVERATGNYAINRNTLIPPRSGLGWITPGGVETALGSGPPAGWGALAGIDVRHDPATYGTGTPGASAYAWDVAPQAHDPDGLPLVGNLGFGLTLAAQPSMAPGLWLASAAELVPSVQVLGLELHIHPAFLASGALGGTSPQRIPIPIPADPSLVDQRFFFQSVHFEPQGLAASNALVMTILQP